MAEIGLGVLKELLKSGEEYANSKQVQDAVKGAPRTAFYAGEEAADRFYGKGVRPNSDQMDYVDPTTNVVRTWIPDDGFTKREVGDSAYPENSFNSQYTHPNMMKAYPGLGDAISIVEDSNMRGLGGYKDEIISLNPNNITRSAKTAGRGVSDVRNEVVLHEMAHGAQRRDKHYDNVVPSASRINQEFGRGSEYWNHPLEAEARAAGNYYKNGSTVPANPGLGALRDDMREFTGDTNFSNEPSQGFVKNFKAYIEGKPWEGLFPPAPKIRKKSTK
jgi:hypothetical protein